MDKYIKFRHIFTIGELELNFPPKFINKNKKFIYNSLPALSPASLEQKVRVTKWDAIDFPDKVPTGDVEHKMFQDAFPYTPSNTNGTTSWYVNFADARLFGFFEGPLFAQDEMQVMEHPCLGSIRNALAKIAQTIPQAGPYVRTSHGSHMYSTPILIKGAQRRVAVATNADEERGRPKGLYGNVFSHASEEAIKNALTMFDPPTITNLIAIEAPKGGYEEYTRAQIGDAFGTAYTGFLAAVAESRDENPQEKVVIHTGNWGTGAFGGNKILMACIQIFASHVAQVDELVFHTFEPTATDAYLKGKALCEELLKQNKSVDEVLEILFEKKFQWGYSDGN